MQDVWPCSSNFLACTATSLVSSLCFIFEECAIGPFNWRPFLVVSNLIVVTLTDVLLLQYSWLSKLSKKKKNWSQLGIFLAFSCSIAWSRS